jgi:hypothetical protein
MELWRGKSYGDSKYIYMSCRSVIGGSAIPLVEAPFHERPGMVRRTTSPQANMMSDSLFKLRKLAKTRRLLLVMSRKLIGPSQDLATACLLHVNELE